MRKDQGRVLVQAAVYLRSRETTIVRADYAKCAIPQAITFHARRLRAESLKYLREALHRLQLLNMGSESTPVNCRTLFGGLQSSTSPQLPKVDYTRPLYMYVALAWLVWHQWKYFHRTMKIFLVCTLVC
jgi:hypothetical protein